MQALNLEVKLMETIAKMRVKSENMNMNMSECTKHQRNLLILSYFSLFLSGTV